MTGLLASVRSVAEAQLALQSYADIIDCKNPAAGALGALPPETISSIVEAVGGARRVSATTGDHIHGIRQLREAVATTADCGVDYVKLGLFDHAQAVQQIHGLGRISHEHDLIAVCFADRYDPAPLLPLLAAAGFRGVMLDTAYKTGGRLTELYNATRLADFVHQAQAHGLLCGLAGRLQLGDIADLLPLCADYLGFRSALCGNNGDRRGDLEQVAMMRLREAIPFPAGTSPIAPLNLSLH